MEGEFAKVGRRVGAHHLSRSHCMPGIVLNMLHTVNGPVSPHSHEWMH